MAVARILAELRTELSDDLVLLGKGALQLLNHLLQAAQAFEQVGGVVLHIRSVAAERSAS